MKTTSLKRLSALFLASVLTGVMPLVLRAQPVLWHFQSFTGDICGLYSFPPVTLTYDPAQDDTGDGGGSCHISTDYSRGGVFQLTIGNVDCCYCALEANLQLSNFTSVEFDVKWDNASTVPLSYFNANYGSGDAGIVIGVGSVFYEGISSICYSNLIIPDAATNGWVHVSMAINQALTNTSFVGLAFEKVFPAYVASGTAAFWLDNIALAGPLRVSAVPQVCEGGNFTLQAPAIRGKTYTILKSADLVKWTSLVTGYPPGGATANSPLSFTDTNAKCGQAYYRIRSP